MESGKLKIMTASPEALNTLGELGHLLWPHHGAAELAAEFAETMADPDAAFFLAVDEEAVGFAQCGLRRDYGEGTESSPVGYLEGIFVKESHRGRGIARGLLEACRDWAREKGCREFASDCELHNEQSLRFHLAVGFAEAGRIICFTSKL